MSFYDGGRGFAGEQPDQPVRGFPGTALGGRGRWPRLAGAWPFLPAQDAGRQRRRPGARDGGGPGRQPLGGHHRPEPPPGSRPRRTSRSRWFPPNRSVRIAVRAIAADPQGGVWLGLGTRSSSATATGGFEAHGSVGDPSRRWIVQPAARRPRAVGGDERWARSPAPRKAEHSRHAQRPSLRQPRGRRLGRRRVAVVEGRVWPGPDSGGRARRLDRAT